MQRFMLLAALCAALVLVLATAALAQSRGPSGADGTYNCEDFDTQEQAQAFFNNDPGDTNGLDGPPGDAFTGEPGVACEDLPSGGTGTTAEPPVEATQPTAPGQYVPPAEPAPQVTAEDLDCADFASQTEAQAVLDADSTDPNGLDADGDGIACEELFQSEPTEPMTQYPSLNTNPNTLTEAPGEETTSTTQLPATGGPSLVLIAGAVLVGAGLVLRRR